MAFGVVAVVAAGVCVRLGFWQLDRLDQRRAKNALVLERTRRPPVSISEVGGQDTSDIHWRHVRLRGVADYASEMLHATRSQAGSPGVYLLTPVRPLDGAWGDTAIVVLRGFVYAPDGRTIDWAQSRDADTLDLEALVTEFPPVQAGTVRMPSAPRAVRFLNRDTLAALMHRPVAPFVLLALGDTIMKDISKPTRVPPPSQTEGSHQSYAYQWFAFALVALIGFSSVVWTEFQRDQAGREAA